MTQKDKELLLKDLSARLPYGIICDCLHSIQCKATIIDVEDMTVYYTDCDEWESIEHCKPYLRPMSSMTLEENKKLDEIWLKHTIMEGADYLNSIHVDYRGLIPKGLAIEAPKGMYNNKEK